MADEDRDRLLGHNYDGIEEYDNPLPGWWVWLFWATIVFSALYLVYYHVGPGTSIIADYEGETRAAAERVSTAGPVTPAPTEESIAALQTDARAMAKATEVFAARCAPCHGPQGQGVIGPNLTDEYWIHGSGKLTDIYQVISDGVPDKGMVSWKGQLGPAEIQAMAAYVGTLRGTHPPNPKPPQGQKVAGGR